MAYGPDLAMTTPIDLTPEEYDLPGRAKRHRHQHASPRASRCCRRGESKSGRSLFGAAPPVKSPRPPLRAPSCSLRRLEALERVEEAAQKLPKAPMRWYPPKVQIELEGALSAAEEAKR